LIGKGLHEFSAGSYTSNLYDPVAVDVTSLPPPM